MSLSYWDYLTLLLLRPLFAIAAVLVFIVSGWYLAWKLVLVHVPLVQEIFGLKKKPIKPKPPTRGRFSKFYSTMETQNSASKCEQQSENRVGCSEILLLLSEVASMDLDCNLSCCSVICVTSHVFLICIVYEFGFQLYNWQLHKFQYEVEILYKHEKEGCFRTM